MGRNVDTKEFLLAAECELERIFYSHQGLTIHKWHHYLEAYDRHLSSFLSKRRRSGDDRPVRLLEIGVGSGGSLQMWRKYLGPSAIVFGVDIDQERVAVAARGGSNVRAGSQADPAFLKAVVEEMGGLDIVIDDGSHISSHQRISFETLFPSLADDGVYLCEDLHTAYGKGYEGGLCREGTFIELTKTMIDWLHRHYVVDAQLDDPYDFSGKVFGIHIYDSVVIIEKRLKEAPFHTRSGAVRSPSG